MFSQLIIILIRAYQLFISPIFITIAGNHGCRFRPTCSENTIQQIKQHGLQKGLIMGWKQFSSCHPFAKTEKVVQ